MRCNVSVARSLPSELKGQTAFTHTGFTASHSAERVGIPHSWHLILNNVGNEYMYFFWTEANNQCHVKFLWQIYCVIKLHHIIRIIH